MKNNNFNNLHEKAGYLSLNNLIIPGNFRLRVGLLFIIFGILWMGKIVGWFEKDIFGPLVMLTLGIWFSCSYVISRIDTKINNWTSSLKLSDGDYYGL